MIEPIQNITSGNQTGVTFSNIPQTYKHLMLIVNGKCSTGNSDIGVQINGDTGSNYNWHMLWANGQTGTSAGSLRQTTTRMQITDWAYMDTNVYMNSIVTFHCYTNTNLWKTSNFKAVRGNSGGGVDVGQNTWRNTNAITSLYVFGANQNFASGSTFSLYGII